MAQVLAPIVQTTGTITMLHSSSDAFQNTPAQPHPQQQRSSQMPRAQAYNVPSPGAGYRGTSAPIAPYAFSSTPQLRQENRSSSAPNQQSTQPANPSKLGHPSHPSSSSDSTVSTSGSSNRSLVTPTFTAKDDVSVRRSIVDDVPPTINLSTTVPDLSLSLSESPSSPVTSEAPVKPSPGRYRRAASRTDSTNSATASSSTPTPTQQSPPMTASSTAAAARSNLPPLSTIDLPPPTRPTHNRASSVDDTQTARGGTIDQAKRYRRRSLSGLDANAMANGTTSPSPPVSTSPIITPKRQTQEFRPGSSSSRHGSRPSSSQSHERQGSAGSTSSIGSNRPSSRQGSSNLRAPAATSPASKSPEPSRRMAPSPLSQPMSPSEPPSPAKMDTSTASPAVKQLAALNDKEGGKGMKSRLRRAFSFGSAAELRRASAENSIAAERAKLRKDRYQTEEEAEQAAIVAKQEAAGIGAGIYSGQGGFSGSTDNLSISSTASSASIMLRKMGSGMKKGTRSIKGLFRPKSVIGVPAADGPVKPSVGQVSMVTVEAERQKVNVNANPHEQVGGGTGYPRLERNSLDAGRSTDASSTSGAANDVYQRKSIIGSDKERAEVLSSIKKGILKRNGTGSDASSPVTRPVDAPQAPESVKASAPNTPLQDHNSDYFGKPPRLANPSTRSLPTTPQGSLRNISFSPRIQFHDAWSASDYDRRGEIATCNRLTPMLAQQIKEELNSFKMEMEVHELSKPHTHFF